VTLATQPPPDPEGGPTPPASPNGATDSDNCRDTSHGRDGVLWARGGIAAGAGVSIAANVAHSYIAPAGQDPETWDPPLAAVLGAACWPLALFLALEVLSSPLWPRGRWWWALRVALVGPVAAVAAVVSYHHLSGLLASWHEDPFTVRFGPIAIDGLMGLCSALLFIARAGADEPDLSVVGPDRAVGPEPFEPVIPGRPEGAVATVYRLYDAEGSLLYVGCTVDPWTRLKAHRRRQPWWDEVVDAEVIWFLSVELAADVEQQAIFTESPVYNIAMGRYGHRFSDAADVEPEPQPQVPDAPVVAPRAPSSPGPDLFECTCGLDKCAGRVSKSTRTRHRKELSEALELADLVAQNGHRDPAANVLR